MSITVLLECPSCGEELHYKSNQPSNAVLCPYCGKKQEHLERVFYTEETAERIVLP